MKRAPRKDRYTPGLSSKNRPRSPRSIAKSLPVWVTRAELGYGSEPAVGDPSWVRSLLRHENGMWIADALHCESSLPEDLGRLSIVPPDDAELRGREPLR